MTRSDYCGVVVALMTMLICGATIAAEQRPSSVPSATVASQIPFRDTGADLWVATDALNRRLPDQATCGPPRPNKFVGMFYFLWLEPAGKPLLDLTKLLAANPDHPAYGPPGFMHWWGEPRLGYYDICDPWLLAKHAQMLADAGVDVIVFDVTNGPTYESSYLALCRVYADLRALGRKTPQIAFLTHTDTRSVVERLMDRLYRPKLYPELWFRWRGKPLLLAKADELSPDAREFFTLRESWAWSKGQDWFGDGRDKWTWLDNFPQNPGWHESPDKPEAISVCVAQHATSNIGRSFHGGREPPPAERAPEKGLCFAEQWRRALEVDPEFVFVTGWNEWVAGRFISDGTQPFLGHIEPKGGSFFVDEYSQEFSRDIEPMRGGHGDNYYYQLVDNIRRFKGVRKPAKPSAEVTMLDDAADFAAWRDVSPEYLDDLGDTAHRNHAGWGEAAEKPYVNTSGRNDLATAKVARDAKYIYFYLQTRDPIAPTVAPTKLCLLLDIDADATREKPTGWHGYDLVAWAGNETVWTISQFSPPEGQALFFWEAKARLRGAELQLAIPRGVLGLGKEKGPLKFDFKWVDNLSGASDPQDFIDQGDLAPNGRFNYRFVE